ncbi:MAG: hypothetical protein ACTSWN_12855, partial [Promethearchaeota archaeon]
GSGMIPIPRITGGIRFLPISVSPLAVAFRQDFPEFLHVNDNMAFRCPLCPGRSLLGRAYDHSAHAPCAVAIWSGCLPPLHLVACYSRGFKMRLHFRSQWVILVGPTLSWR